MGKIKQFITKYRWWIIGVVGALAVWLMLGRDKGGGGGDEYMVSQFGAPYVDPNAMALTKQNTQLQFQLDAKNASLNTQYQMALLESDIQRFKIDSDLNLGLAQIDADKFLGNLEASTNKALANIGADTMKYTSDIQLKAENIKADTINRQTEASKYIAGQHASVAKYNARKQSQSQIIGGLFGLANKFI